MTVRRPLTLADRIRQHPAMPVAELAEMLGCRRQTISDVRYRDKDRPRLAKRQRERHHAQRAARSALADYGSPRFAAWCQHWRNTGRGELARSAEMLRRPIETETEWPPESPEVEQFGGLAWRIPYGTPEWASHVAAKRLAIGAGIATRLEFSKRDLAAEHTRWGECSPRSPTASPTGAADAASPAAASPRDLRSPRD